MVLNFTHPLEISESLTTKNKKIESLLIQNNNLKKIINNLNNKLNNSDTFKMIKKLESDYQTIINTRTALHKQLDEYVSTIDYQNKEITMLAEQRNSALKEVTFYKKQIKELNSDNNTSQKYHYIEKFTKKIKYLKEQIRPKNISVDEDFFGKKRGVKEMEAAQFAKFSQNVDLKDLLLKTHKAKLQHFARGSPPIVFYDLMIVRQKLV